jgi:hypothetical protein
VADLSHVPHRVLAVHRVVVATADPAAFEVAGLDQLGDDPLHGAFGDSDRVGDVPEPHVGIVGEAEQHLGVVREERPAPVLTVG